MYCPSAARHGELGITRQCVSNYCQYSKPRLPDLALVLASERTSTCVSRCKEIFPFSTLVEGQQAGLHFSSVEEGSKGC
ncbi:hypothetical protein I3842_15G073500 [Carya illinoinensis]|uniref:Uncharacterized protein n=1 Tax=Carya illinoinensis TaxID=32201 RepID=A0A922DAR2_CARIL|nr:hypothetical protein I3842_15G073500 [Carya illinoinensis]